MRESMYIKCIQPVNLNFEKGKTYKATRKYGKKRWEVEIEEYQTTTLNTITIGDINIYTSYRGTVFMSDEDINTLTKLKVKKERKPLLILCIRSDIIDRYLKKVLYIDSKSYSYYSDVEYYPYKKDTDYDYYINRIKENKPFAVVPKTLDFVDALLNSDLEFKIVKISEYVREINVESFTKEELFEKGKDSNFDPRD